MIMEHKGYDKQPDSQPEQEDMNWLDVFIDYTSTENDTLQSVEPAPTTL